MLRFILLFALMSLCAAAIAQTARIAHRSHSGSNAKFAYYGDNFGLKEPYKKPAPIVKTPKDAAGAGKKQGTVPPKKQEPGAPKKKPVARTAH